MERMLVNPIARLQEILPLVEEFIKRTRTEAKIVTEEVKAALSREDWTILAWEEKGKITGYLLAVEHPGGVVWIPQLLCRRGTNVKKFIETCEGALKKAGTRKILFVSLHHPRLWTKYGCSPFGYAYLKDLEEKEE